VIELADPFAGVPPPTPACRATVVIPAHNEAQHIVRTLQALARQRDVDGSPLAPDTFDVLVYANNCSDATAELVRGFAARHPAYAVSVAEGCLPANVAHVGTARRAAMDAASRRFAAAGTADAILAGTDADTVAAPMWLAWTLREMRSADAVMGRILVDPLEWWSLPEHTRRMLSEENTYQFTIAQLQSHLSPRPHDPWPRHWQRSGPSFAVRVSAYEHAGGVPPVRVLEDIALYDALARDGARIRHSLRVRVFTSARLQSRAPGGFGTRIGEWNALPQACMPLLVEDPGVTLRRLRGDDVAASERRPCIPVADATAILRQMIGRGGTAARATRSSVASIAG